VRYSLYGVPTAIASADINRDGVVDERDVSLFVNGWVQGEIDRRLDVNNNGRLETGPPIDPANGLPISNWDDDDDLSLFTKEFVALYEWRLNNEPTPPDPTTALFDGTGTDADGIARGKLSREDIDNRIGAAGMWWDPHLGIYHVRHRAYDPRLGRFLQPDPIGVAGGWNVFEYVGGDPANFVDPMGLWPQWLRNLGHEVVDGFDAARDKFSGREAEELRRDKAASSKATEACLKEAERLKAQGHPNAECLKAQCIGTAQANNAAFNQVEKIQADAWNKVGDTIEDTAMTIVGAPFGGASLARQLGINAAGYAAISASTGGNVGASVARGLIGVGGGAAFGKALQVGGKGIGSAVGKSLPKHGHHPIPKFLGGHEKQTLINLPSNVHTEFHSVLRTNLINAGFDLPIGGRTGSTQAWERLFRSTPGAQQRAFDAVRRASEHVDRRNGTSATRYFWNSIQNGDYFAWP
jgi:RHS repeat-associated protein